jgi:hypothetical protein
MRAADGQAVIWIVVFCAIAGVVAAVVSGGGV